MLENGCYVVQNFFLSHPLYYLGENGFLLTVIMAITDALALLSLNQDMSTKQESAFWVGANY